MRFKILDAIRGKSELPRAKLDRLFAISTASITMEANLGLSPGGAAGICLKPIESSRYEAARSEIEDLLKYSARETGTKYRVEKDEYRYLWVVLEDPDFDDLVVNVHLVSTTMVEHGFGEQLLCALYQFRGRDGPVYWIYSFKGALTTPSLPSRGIIGTARSSFGCDRLWSLSFLWRRTWRSGILFGGRRYSAYSTTKVWKIGRSLGRVT